MMDVRVFRDRVYTVAMLTLFAVLFAIYGLLLVITQYFQNIQDYSPERAGLHHAGLHRADDHPVADRRRPRRPLRRLGVPRSSASPW